MAYLVATANGNLTAAATWKVCNATLFTDSEAGNAAIGVTWTGPTTGQTPGAITVDGIAVKIHSRVATPAGTFSVRLYNITDATAVAGTMVTVDAADILRTGAGQNGWMFFAFAAPVTLIAAKSYRVEAICSIASEVTLYRDGTASNWAKLVRTTTTQAPSAGDNLFILGEWTAQGTKTDRAVTMDSTAATDYGDGVENGLAKFGISNGGSLTWGTTAATNYILRLSGVFAVWGGGVHTMGSVATPCPRDSSMELQFDVVTTNLAFGMLVWGTFTAQGLSRTVGKNVWRCSLTATTIAGSATWNVDTDTGWLNGDEVLIAATRPTHGESEKLALSGAAGASSFTTTANAAKNHDVTTNFAARVLLVSRNVRITNVTTTKVCCGVHGLDGAVIDCDWVLFQRCSGTTSSAVLLAMGVDADANVQFDYCFFGDAAMAATLNWIGFTICGLAATVTFTGTLRVTNCGVGNNQGSSGTPYVFYLLNNASAHLATLQVDQLSFVGGTKTGTAEATWFFQQIYGEFTNIDVWGTSSTVAQFSGSTARRAPSKFTLHNLTCVGVATSAPISVACEEEVVLGTINLFRCANGFSVSSRLTINGGLWIGNTSGPLGLNSGAAMTVRNVTAKGETGYTATFFTQNISASVLLRLENVVTGGLGANENFTTATFQLAGIIPGPWQFINCLFNEATRWNNPTSLRQMTVAWQRAQQVSGDHYTYYGGRGYVRYETTVFRTAAPSERLQLGDNIASVANADVSWPLKSSARRIGVRAGYRATVSVWVRKDGSYAGTAPRLRYGANPAIGIDLEGTLDTLSVGADEWEQLTGIVPSSVAEEDGVVTVWLEADGAAGNVYVDDWTTVEA